MTDGFWREKSALVTGAGGFVGSWLTKALLDRGARVTVVLRDDSRPSNFVALGLASLSSIVRGSVTDLELVERSLNEYEVDTCFHLAAQAIVGAANRSPVATFEANIRGTWTVLEACRRVGTIKRVVVASSDKAYGTSARLPYTEDMPLLGLNPYDVSKACGESIARSYRHTYGLPLAIARCANVYGGGDLNFSRAVPGTIRSVLFGERPVIRSDGTPVRDYLHVADAVEAYLLLAERLEERHLAGEAFNFGSEKPISTLDLVRRILTACHAQHIEPEVRGSGRPPGEINEQYMSSEKARRLLGWRAAVALDVGLADAIDWYARFLGVSRAASHPAVRP